MNEKIEAILLQIVTQLKKLKWQVTPDWKLVIKSDGHVSLIKSIEVNGGMNGEEWNDEIETTINLSLTSNDEITYFPSVTILAQIEASGGGTKDVSEDTTIDIDFTEREFSDKNKPQTVAQRIDRYVSEIIQHEYDVYFETRASDIMAYKAGGWRADYDPER